MNIKQEKADIQNNTSSKSKKQRILNMRKYFCNFVIFLSTLTMIVIMVMSPLGEWQSIIKVSVIMLVAYAFYEAGYDEACKDIRKFYRKER